MSTDVACFDYSVYFVHLLWKGPIELAVFGYLIYLEIGFYGWIGLGFILCFVPIQCKHLVDGSVPLTAIEQHLKLKKKTQLPIPLENQYSI